MRRSSSWASVLLALATAVSASSSEGADLDRALHRLYSYDFAGAHAALDQALGARPGDPLLHAVRGAAILFGEFDRLQILEFEFFADDERITARERLRPDPAARERLLRTTASARRLALERLAVEPRDREALFAVCTAVGAEMDYFGLVEKSYLRAYWLSKEAQRCAQRLLALEPPLYDGYLTLGSVEYVVSNLNFVLRLFVRFEEIEGTKERAIENLDQVVRHGRYFRPFAMVLLAAIHAREGEPRKALVLLRQMGREYPENPLVRDEIRRLEAKVR